MLNDVEKIIETAPLSESNFVGYTEAMPRLLTILNARLSRHISVEVGRSERDVFRMLKELDRVARLQQQEAVVVSWIFAELFPFYWEMEGSVVSESWSRITQRRGPGTARYAPRAKKSKSRRPIQNPPHAREL